MTMPLVDVAGDELQIIAECPPHRENAGPAAT
jgi:hypothetical protein